MLLKKSELYVAACKADKQSSSIQSREFVFPLHFIYWRRSLSDLSLSAGVVFRFGPEISRIPAGLFLCKAHKFGRGNLWQNCRKQQQHRQPRPVLRFIAEKYPEQKRRLVVQSTVDLLICTLPLISKNKVFKKSSSVSNLRKSCKHEGNSSTMFFTSNVKNIYFQI